MEGILLIGLVGVSAILGAVASRWATKRGLW